MIILCRLISCSPCFGGPLEHVTDLLTSPLPPPPPLGLLRSTSTICLTVLDRCSCLKLNHCLSSPPLGPLILSAPARLPPLHRQILSPSTLSSCSLVLSSSYARRLATTVGVERGDYDWACSMARRVGKAVKHIEPVQSALEGDNDKQLGQIGVQVEDIGLEVSNGGVVVDGVSNLAHSWLERYRAEVSEVDGAGEGGLLAVGRCEVGSVAHWGSREGEGVRRKDLTKATVTGSGEVTVARSIHGVGGMIKEHYGHFEMAGRVER